MISTVNNFILIIESIRNNSSLKFKNETLKIIREIVHKATFENGAYIWINEVVDYNGGEKYGIRQVHGNLPETEGAILSTLTKDAIGNTPYLTELEGIKKDGEIIYNYFFKEYKSKVESEKITYAKLYKPYNWIICTGTYLNSMYTPVGGVTKKFKVFFYSVASFLFSMALFLLCYIIISNFIVSKKLINETNLLKLEVSKDSLTGAASRSYGSSLLQEYFNTYKKYGKNYFLAILDIDNFKILNDKYGHNFGDEVIKKMVNTVKNCINQDDHIIRWGGDEFIITFKNEENIESKLGLINKKINIQEINTESGNKIHFSISIGASNFSNKDDSVKDTIKRIDDALYLSKRHKNSYYVI